MRFFLTYILAPPLTIAGKVLGVAFRPAFEFLDTHLARRNNRRLAQDLHNELPFLFTEHHGRIVPTPGISFPPGFDYAFVTVEVGNVLVRFCRGRGELDVGVSSKRNPLDIYDLRLVLSLMDNAGDPDRGPVANLQHASGLLQAGLKRLETALGHTPDDGLLRRLAEFAASERIAIKEAEWELNKRLPGRC